jgi:uncharacterized protein YjiS (DUF1127 family)
MSLSYSLHEPVRPASRGAAGKNPLAGWLGRVAQWFARRRQWRHLRELDDRLLADVGISPEEAFRSAGRPLQSESPVGLELGTGGARGHEYFSGRA